jgi:3',5'-cyclic AMP phosphodiesterase CpdA
MKAVKNMLQVICLGLVLLVPCAQVNRAQEQCTPLQFRFIVYGDTRTNDDIHINIVDKVTTLQPKPSFILQTGDLVEGGTPKQWAEFDIITAVIHNRGIQYYPARGNHDTKGVKGEYEKRVTEPFRPGGSKLYYAFDKGNIRFISIDTEQKLTAGTAAKPGSPEYEWLKSELENARNEHKFVIPFFHRAAFSVGDHGSDFKVQKVLHPLFRQYGVTLVFQGHDHIYYRTVRDGIAYVVTGGGGAPLYSFANLNQGLPGDVKAQENHFCVLDVCASNIAVKVYADKIGNKSLEEAKKTKDITNQGTLVEIDRFSIPIS